MPRGGLTAAALVPGHGTRDTTDTPRLEEDTGHGTPMPRSAQLLPLAAPGRATSLFPRQPLA
eukprot:637576-Karenia_brevis.AAC.1